MKIKILKVEPLADGSLRVWVETDDPDAAGQIMCIPNVPNVEAFVESVLSEGQRRRATWPSIKETLERLVEKEENAQAAKTNPASPPVIAELFISLLAPKNTAQVQLGDLQEMFAKNVERLGEKQARRKYWMQVAASVRPLLCQWVKRIGLVTLLVDYVRSKLGL